MVALRVWENHLKAVDDREKVGQSVIVWFVRAVFVIVWFARAVSVIVWFVRAVSVVVWFVPCVFAECGTTT